MIDIHRKPDAVFLQRAYRLGVFPMADPDTGRIDWYQPSHRGVIPLGAFHVPHMLRRVARRCPFRITADSAFREVMTACAGPRADDDETWISGALIDAYTELHEAGRAHSVEAWKGDVLVGGLYGVHLGTAFFGESMFHDAAAGGTDASKLCLLHLVGWMRQQEFTLLDTQLWSPHLARLGCVEMPNEEFEVLLEQALEGESEWGSFDAEIACRLGLHPNP